MMFFFNSPISPCTKGFPSPAPLVLTPSPSKESSCFNCEAAMTPDHQCEAVDSDSNWEDVENELDLFPTLEVDSEDWAEKFTNNIRRFHGNCWKTLWLSRKVCSRGWGVSPSLGLSSILTILLAMSLRYCTSLNLELHVRKNQLDNNASSQLNTLWVLFLWLSQYACYCSRRAIGGFHLILLLMHRALCS